MGFSAKAIALLEYDLDPGHPGTNLELTALRMGHFQVAVVTDKGKIKVRSDLTDTLGALTRPRDERRAERFTKLPKAPKKQAPSRAAKAPRKATAKKTASKR